MFLNFNKCVKSAMIGTYNWKWFKWLLWYHCAKHLSNGLLGIKSIMQMFYQGLSSYVLAFHSIVTHYIISYVFIAHFLHFRALENASLMSKELGEFDMVAQLAERACKLYRNHGTVDTAAATLDKAAIIEAHTRWLMISQCGNTDYDLHLLYL